MHSGIHNAEKVAGGWGIRRLDVIEEYVLIHLQTVNFDTPYSLLNCVTDCPGRYNSATIFKNSSLHFLFVIWMLSS